MDDAPSSLPEGPSTPPPAPHGGIDITGGEVRAERDIVAGDVNIAGDSISGGTITVQRGYSAADVQRLVLIVGGLVFLTAACFFIFGAVSAAALVNVLNRPLVGGSRPEDALTMQRKIDALNSLQPGQEFRVTFSEDEISSYFRFVLGPAIGVSDGKARFLEEPGQIAIGGIADNYGHLPFLAQVNVTTGETPFQLQGAWIKVLPTPEGVSFGYIPVTPLAQDLNARINALLFGKVQFTTIRQTGGGPQAPAAPAGNNLILTGVAE